MRENLQLTMFAEVDNMPDLDDVAYALVIKLKRISEPLFYGDTLREGLVNSFIWRTDEKVSTLDNIASAVTLLKHNFLKEQDLKKFFGSSSVQALKHGLLLLEAVAEMKDFADEDNLVAVWSTTKIISDTLNERGYNNFVLEHYTGEEFG